MHPTPTTADTRRPGRTLGRRALPFLAAAFALSVYTPAGTAAQSVRVGDPLVDYLRVTQLLGADWEGSGTVRPIRPVVGSGSAPSPRIDPWEVGGWQPERSTRTSTTPGARILDPSVALDLFWNSDFADGQNDGAVWQGQGLTSAIEVGAGVAVGPLSLDVRPRFLRSANGDFAVANPQMIGGDRIWSHAWSNYGIDLPQRFGPDPVTRVDPGESTLRLRAGGVSIGAGTEAEWWGPGVRNALILSDNAGGFPHLDLGTDGAVRVGGLGQLEARWIWGRLDHSQWWDESVTSEDRFLTGLVLAFRPSGLPNLTVGGIRSAMRLIPEGGLGADDILQVFTGGLTSASTGNLPETGSDPYNGLVSLFLRWAFPGTGAELWGEWGRNDAPDGLSDFLEAPGHSQGWTLGARKAWALEGQRILVLTGEVTELGRTSTGEERPDASWYRHNIVQPGWTHRGQLIGASITGGSDSQYLGARMYHWRGLVELFVQRRNLDHDDYERWLERGNDVEPHTAIDLGVGTLYRVGDLGIEAGIVWRQDSNRYFEPGADATNLKLTTGLRWSPR